jgi:hypothetical protein
MRGLTRPRSVVVVTGGHALVQNIRRGHYELAVDRDNHHRVAVYTTDPDHDGRTTKVQ